MALEKAIGDTIFKVRVDKTQMKNFPFDVFYLVHVSRKALLPRLFPWALCVPMHEDLERKIQNLSIEDLEEVPHTGDRHTSSIRKATYTGRRMDALGVIVHKQSHFVIVPVLPLTTPHRYCKSWKRKQPPSSRVPTYLMAPHHAKGHGDEKPKLEGILGDDTVLFTPHGPKRPVCLLCPRHLLHLQGQCQLGCNHCYNELILKRSPANVELQEHDADTDFDSIDS